MAAAPIVTDDTVLRRFEHAENFPVALRVLPARHRDALRAAYDVARLIDEVGDDPATPPTGRSRLLDTLDADLRRVFAGQHATSPVVAGLGPVIEVGRVRIDPFLELVEANRMDQRVSRYQTYDDLRAYCALSANPVGRIVLDVFGVDGEHERRLSDLVCTALQLVEHCQDVAEDKRLRDRVYLPLDDLAQFGVEPDDLAAATTDAVRQLVTFEVDRAAALLDEGRSLVSLLHGWARVAVTGYLAGGYATVDALRRDAHQVLEHSAHARRSDVARHAIRLLAGR